MGQYHKIFNLDKREYLSPHTLGCGLKLMEQIDTQAGTPTALMVLLAASNGRGGGDFRTDHPTHKAVIGRWAGDRIAIIGDYAERDDLKPEHDADIAYSLTGGEAVFSAKAHYATIAEQDPGKAAEFRDKARRLGESALYTDITPLVADYLSVLCDVEYVGVNGWKDVRRTQPKGA